MRTALLSTFLYCCIFLFANNNGKNVLRVELKDGTKNDYILEERPQIKFAEDKTIFFCNSMTTEYSTKDIGRFFFVSEETRISELHASDTRVRYTGGKLLLESASEPYYVSVHSLDGKKQQVAINKVGQQLEISLSNLPNGYYIINISNRLSIKVLKK